MNYDAITSHESALNALPILKTHLTQPAISARIPLSADYSQYGAIIWLFVDPQRLTRAIVQDIFVAVLDTLSRLDLLSGFVGLEVYIAAKLPSNGTERYVRVSVDALHLDDAVVAFSRSLDERVKGQYECFFYQQID